MTEAAPLGYSGTQLLSAMLASGMASSVIGIILTYWLVTRKKLPQELDEGRARTRLADAQTDHTLAETLEIVSAQLHATNKILVETEKRANARAEYVELLELQVAKARHEGFLEREVAGGTGPNPAA